MKQMIIFTTVGYCVRLKSVHRSNTFLQLHQFQSLVLSQLTELSYRHYIPGFTTRAIMNDTSAPCCVLVCSKKYHHHHSLLVKLTYRSRTQGGFKNLTA